VRAALTRHGVDTSRCRAIASGYRTSLALAETRAADCEVVIYRNGAADLQLGNSDIDPAFIATAAVLVVTGTSLASEPSRSAAMQAIDLARSGGTFVVFDVDHRPYSWVSTGEATAAYRAAASLADAVVGNDEELAIIAGDRGDALATARALVSGGRAFAVLKRGEHGSLTATPEGTLATSAYPVAVKKPFGAGDAFVGGLIAGLLRGLALPAALRQGAAAGAIVVSRRGCASAMPDTAEVEALLSSTPVVGGAEHAHPAV